MLSVSPALSSLLYIVECAPVSRPFSAELFSSLLVSGEQGSEEVVYQKRKKKLYQHLPKYTSIRPGGWCFKVSKIANRPPSSPCSDMTYTHVMIKGCCKNTTVIRERQKTSNPPLNPSHNLQPVHNLMLHTFFLFVSVTFSSERQART